MSDPAKGDGPLEWGVDSYSRQLREAEATPGSPENLIELSKKAAAATTQEDLERFLAQEPVFESANLALSSVGQSVEIKGEHRFSTSHSFTGSNTRGFVNLVGKSETASRLFDYKYEIEISPGGRLSTRYHQQNPFERRVQEGNYAPHLDPDTSDPRVGALVLSRGLAELGIAVAHTLRMRRYGETILDSIEKPLHPAVGPALEMAGLAAEHSLDRI